MTNLPILFSGAMVRAILREIEQPGTGKTQTRRVIDFPGIDKVLEFAPVGTDRKTGRRIFEMKDAAGKFVHRPAGKHVLSPYFSPRYAVGDRLYVREAWRCEARLDKRAPREIATNYPGIKYIATAEPDDFGIEGKFRQAMHMPRWASRITLIVTDVRVQRLQEISDEDALAEGVTSATTPIAGIDIDVDGQFWPGAPARMFGKLWDSLNADRGYGWDANPWVAAYTFRPIAGNIDQVPA